VPYRELSGVTVVHAAVANSPVAALRAMKSGPTCAGVVISAASKTLCDEFVTATSIQHAGRGGLVLLS
jgi:hypothetical protein